VGTALAGMLAQNTILTTLLLSGNRLVPNGNGLDPVEEMVNAPLEAFPKTTNAQQQKRQARKSGSIPGGAGLQDLDLASCGLNIRQSVHLGRLIQEGYSLRKLILDQNQVFEGKPLEAVRKQCSFLSWLHKGKDSSTSKS